MGLRLSTPTSAASGTKAASQPRKKYSGLRRQRCFTAVGEAGPRFTVSNIWTFFCVRPALGAPAFPTCQPASLKPLSFRIACPSPRHPPLQLFLHAATAT